MTRTEEETMQATGPPVDPWQRWSWAFAGVWLVFLAFPLVGVWQAGGTARAVGLGALVAFAATYLRGFAHVARVAPDRVQLLARAYLAGLVALSVVVSAAGGPATLGTAVFVVCFAMFTMSLRTAAVVLATAVGVCLAWPWWLGVLADSWFIVLILLLVGVATGFVRWLEDRQEEHRAVVDQMVLVAERERVARDVHDVLGHSLTVLTIKSELAERLVDVDPEAAKRELAQIRSLTREALGEIRATVGGLRIARLGDELEEARVVLADAGIEAQLPADGDALDPRHRLVCAWVLREAVTNVVRHSGARSCVVELERTGMRVVDDGTGRGTAPEGNGLRGLTERVRGAGGVLSLGAGPDGRGTTLAVSWP